VTTSVNDFNDLVNVMRNRIHGRSIAPRVKDKKLVKDVQRFVHDWRVWFRGPKVSDPAADFSPFLKRYNMLRIRVHAVRIGKKKLKRLAAAPSRVSDYSFDALGTGLKWGGTAFAWGRGIVAGLYLISALQTGRRMVYGE